MSGRHTPRREYTVDAGLLIYRCLRDWPDPRSRFLPQWPRVRVVSHDGLPALSRFFGELPLVDPHDSPPRAHPSAMHAAGSVAVGVGGAVPAPAATSVRRTTRYWVRWSA
ncbi:MAG: hypothetical protein ACRDQ5_11850 [Sciscionella sp.]